MSEQNESYEDLVKQLKPFSCFVHKISAEEFVKLKVVDDPNRIKDEVLAQDVVSVEDEEDEDPEEEIEVVLAEVESNSNNVSNDDTTRHSCFMCKKVLIGYKEGFAHLQLHIDYFPIQCSVCDEANIDVLSFVKHCRSLHPDLEKVKYIHKYNTNCFNWIHNFLTTQPNGDFEANPHKYCPACNWIHLKSPDVNNPNESKQELKPNQVLRHIHEHIRYMPFSCVKCREQGIEYRIHVLDMMPKKHFYDQHKDLVSEPPFWRFFSKKFSIPSLDLFIGNYLSIFGLKVAKKRCKKNRPKAETPIAKSSGQSPKTISLTDSSSHSTPIVIKPVVPQKVVGVKPPLALDNAMLTNILRSLTQNQSIVIPNQLKTNLMIKLNSNPISVNEMENPLLYYASNDKINTRPIPVESTDLGIVCIDPKMMEIDDKLFQYICVFCDSKTEFESKIEASIHYAIHFNYNPVICLICDHKFIDLSLLVIHYKEKHSKYENNIFHYICEDQKIEEWINGFLDFQKTHEFNGKVSVIFGDFCFVCQKRSKSGNGLKLNCEKNNIKAIRDHIHQHLHYFPYKCNVCSHGGRLVQFSSFNSSAFEHLLKIHGLAINGIQSQTDLSKLFVKSGEVLDLEKFIDQKIFPKREQISETPLTLNMKRKLEEIEVEEQKAIELRKRIEVETRDTPKRLEGLAHPLLSNRLNSLVSPLNGNNNRITTSTLSAINQSILKSKTNGLNGMKLTPYPPRPLMPKPMPIECIPSKKTYVDPFLVCFHCHTRVANTSELESHHQSKHPKLTIASYAPTRKDISIPPLINLT